MPKPYITALIDTYNQGRFVEEAIESVLAQDFPMHEVEIIVVDDGSTDDTPERVRRFAGRIRYIRKPNGGQASALNAGFAAAQGQIIAPLDGDDTWLPQKLRRVSEELEKHPEAGFVCHPYLYRLESGARSVADESFIAMQGWIWRSPQFYLQYGRYGTCGLAIRAAIARQLLPIPESLIFYADTFIVNVLPFLTPVRAIKEHLTAYRLHDSNRAAFSERDLARLERRCHFYRRGIEEVQQWLTSRGYNLEKREYRDFIERHLLVVQEFAFECEPPGRREYAAHLRRFNNLYAPLWSARYRLFRACAAISAMVLGYRLHEAGKRIYRNSPVFTRMRRQLAPTAPKPGGNSSQYEAA